MGCGASALPRGPVGGVSRKVKRVLDEKSLPMSIAAPDMTPGSQCEMSPPGGTEKVPDSSVDSTSRPGFRPPTSKHSRPSSHSNILSGDLYQRQLAKDMRKQRLRTRRLNRILAAETYSDSVMQRSDRLSTRSLSSRVGYSERICTPATDYSGASNYDEGDTKVPAAIPAEITSSDLDLPAVEAALAAKAVPLAGNIPEAAHSHTTGSLFADGLTSVKNGQPAMLAECIEAVHRDASAEEPQHDLNAHRAQHGLITDMAQQDVKSDMIREAEGAPVCSNLRTSMPRHAGNAGMVSYDLDTEIVHQHIKAEAAQNDLGSKETLHHLGSDRETMHALRLKPVALSDTDRPLHGDGDTVLEGTLEAGFHTFKQQQQQLGLHDTVLAAASIEPPER